MPTNKAEVPPQRCRHLHATNYDPAQVVAGQLITPLENGQGWCLDCEMFFMPDAVIRYVPASALAEVWEKAIAIARAVEEDDLRPTDGMIGGQVVRERLEAARDAALSVQKENKDEG